MRVKATFALAAILLLVSTGESQVVTTVITHGYSLDGTKGAWVEGMANAIVARAGNGSVFRYEQATGEWELVSGQLHGNGPIVLIYRWLEDFDKFGENWGYAEGAADALHVALRDAVFVEPSEDGHTRTAPIDLPSLTSMHLIGHSRGAVVNSEVVERLARDGIAVDHVTANDPHPVNGTLDPPFNFDWGDPVPGKWENIAFADNYWRADGGFFNAADFDGMPLDGFHNVELDEDALECCAYQFSHSDTHLWYHGTIDTSPNPCDGEECITNTMRNTWWPPPLGWERTGYHYSILGGGVPDRPALPPGIPPGSIDSLYNGDFDRTSYAGWLYHGGAVDGAIVNSGGEQYLRLGAGAGPSATHNRFLLAKSSSEIVFDLRVETASADDLLEIVLTDRQGVEHAVASIPLDVPGGWVRGVARAIGVTACREQAYTLTFRIDGGASIEAVAGLDNIGIRHDAVPGTRLPEGFQTVFGQYESGQVEDLHASDDRYVRIEQRPALSVLLPLIRLEVEGTAASECASEMTVVIETGTNALPSQSPQHLLLFDFDTMLWQLVDERIVTIADGTAEVVIDAGAERFIETGTGALRLRLDWFDPGNVFSPAWGVRVDQAVWSILP